MILSFSSATYTNHQGAALANTPVSVRERGSQTASVVYSTQNGNTAQTMVTNGSGVFSFFALPGEYTVAVGNRNFNVSLPPVPVLTAVKQTLTTRANTVTVTADPELVVPLMANAQYSVDALLLTGGDAAADFRLTFTAPAGATVQWTPRGPGTTVTADPATLVLAQQGVGTEAVVGLYTTGAGIIAPRGTITTAATAGNLSLAWAQGTTNAVPTSLAAGSWLRVIRLRKF